MAKLKNSFNDFLPQKYLDFRRSVENMNSNQAVVAELLRICCEENNIKAIQLAFERILGKPEKVIVIKKTTVRTVFPDATMKEIEPPLLDHTDDQTAAVPITQNKIVVDAADAPGRLLREMLDKIGEKEQGYSSEVLEHKNSYQVAEVMIANLYSIAMRGANLAAISMLFDYLDGAVADVVRIEGEDVVMIENWADVAPYEAKQGEDGIFYIDIEAVK